MSLHQTNKEVRELACDSNVTLFPAPLPGPDYFVSVPDAEYVAAYVGCEGFRLLGKRPKLAVWFQIINDDLDNPLIPAYYNALDIEGKTSDRKRIRDPEFVVGWRSRLGRDIATLYPEKLSPDYLPQEIPNIGASAYPVLISTRSVDKYIDKKERAPEFRSSVIASIVGWADK